MLQKDWARPGYLTKIVRADDRRQEFDCKNQVIVQNEISVDLLFIGDSIMQMWELPAYFHGNGLRILNRGIGGDRTAYLSHRFFADAVQLKPKYTVIMIGINDSWELEDDDMRQEKGRSVQNVLDSAMENMERIFETAREHHMRIAVCSLLPTDMSWTNHEKERRDYICQYNQLLKEMADQFGQRYIDFHSAFLQEEGISLNRELSVEGLHPNAFGYNVMSHILKDELKRENIHL